LVNIRTQFSPSFHICTYDEENNEYGVCLGNLKEEDFYEDVGVGGMIILK